MASFMIWGKNDLEIVRQANCGKFGHCLCLQMIDTMHGCCQPVGQPMHGHLVGFTTLYMTFHTSMVDDHLLNLLMF